MNCYLYKFLYMNNNSAEKSLGLTGCDASDLALPIYRANLDHSSAEAKPLLIDAWVP